jgi:hypothetical protein
VYVVSYDPVPVLASFADRHGIGFPLLSDAEGRAIRAIGLHNDRLVAHAERAGLPNKEKYRGSSYPAVFLLDGDGRVAHRMLFADDHVRPTGPGHVEAIIGGPYPRRGPRARARMAPLDAVVSLDSPSYALYQMVHVIVELHIDDGHWFDPDRPPEVAIAAIPGVEIDAAPLSWRRPGNTDRAVRATVALTFSDRPGAGSHHVAGTVTVGPCDAEHGHERAVIPFSLPIGETGLLGRPYPPTEESLAAYDAHQQRKARYG